MIQIPSYFSFDSANTQAWREQVGAILHQWVVLENPRDPRVLLSPRGGARLLDEGKSLSRGGIWVSSSGSEGDSGLQKWISLSWSALESSALSVNHHLSVRAGDCWIHALPLFHVGGFQVLVRAYLQGESASVVPGVPATERWDPRFFIEQASRTKATLSALVPTQLFDLVATDERAPESLRAVIIGGAALNPGLAQKARSLGWPILASYGMTETASQIATAPESTSISLKILSHAEVRLNSEGRIQVRGPSVTSRVLWLTPQGECHRCEDLRDQEGYLTTSDQGIVEGGPGESQYLHSVMRVSDSVKRLGELVSLSRLRTVFSEVLEKYMESGVVLDWTLTTQPDDRTGVRLLLLVQLQSNSPEFVGLNEVLKKQLDLAPFERLQELIVGENALPRTALGKIRNAELADWIQITVQGNPQRRVPLG